MHISFQTLTVMSMLSFALISNPYAFTNQPRDVQSMQRQDEQRQDQKIQNDKIEQNRLDDKREDQKIQDDKLDQRRLDIQRENQHSIDRQLEQKRQDQRRFDDRRRLDVAARDHHHNNFNDRDDQDLMDDTLDERFLNNNTQRQIQAQQQVTPHVNPTGQCSQNGQCSQINCQDRQALHKLEEGQKCYEDTHKERVHIAEKWDHDHQRD